MKILILEHPRIDSTPHFNDIANTPLWSCVMAGYVYSALAAKGFKVTLLDSNEQGLDFAQTSSAILLHNPDLLSINAVFFWEHTPLFFAMLADLRNKGFSGHINLFGFFPTLHYQQLLKEPTVDSIAIGECEQTIVELASKLASVQAIAGLATLNQPIIPRKQVKDLDQLHFPYRVPNPAEQSVSILASRGCYNHCSFCPIPSFYNNGPLWRGRSVENIIEEITTLVELGTQDFYFIDPNFIGPGKGGRQRIMDLLHQLTPFHIHFGMETRASDLDDELMGQLIKAGLTSLLMGIESGSRRSLDDFGKNESVNESEQGIAVCRRAGIEPEIGFLMFTPDATPQSLIDNINFLERNKLLDRLDRTANLLCHQHIIMAGTTGFSQYKDRNILKEDGPYGFIGKVEFQHEQVKEIADAVINLCHFILRQTGIEKSPLYFKKAGNYQNFAALNDLLVTEISHHISQPGTADYNVSLGKLQNQILHHSATEIPLIDGVGH